jgi:transposase
MVQQGQVFELTRRGPAGERLWAYRYRTGGRDSKRVQRGGFASEQDARDALGRELERLRRERRIARRRTLAELGDCRRFSSSADAVRHTGLDITVHSSDTKRARGHLARQGPGVLRWALFEAAVCAARPASPDHDYYLTVRARLGHQRAVLSVARKLTRWCHHTLRALGEDALAAA